MDLKHIWKKHGICVQLRLGYPSRAGRASIFAGILVDANALKSHNAWRTVRTTTPDCPLSAQRWKISRKNCSAKRLVNATEGKKRAHTHTFFSCIRHPQVRAMPFREGGACMEFAREIKCKIQNVGTQIPIIKHTWVGNNTLVVWPSCSQHKVTTKKWWQCMNNIKTDFPVLGCNPSQREKRKVQTGHWLRHYILPMSVETFVSKFRLKCTKRLGNLQSEAFLNDAVSGDSIGPAHRPAIQFPPRRFHRFFCACPSRLRVPDTRPKGCISASWAVMVGNMCVMNAMRPRFNKNNHVCQKITNYVWSFYYSPFDFKTTCLSQGV